MSLSFIRVLGIVAIVETLCAIAAFFGVFSPFEFMRVAGPLGFFAFGLVAFLCGMFAILGTADRLTARRLHYGRF